MPSYAGYLHMSCLRTECLLSAVLKVAKVQKPLKRGMCVQTFSWSFTYMCLFLHCVCTSRGTSPQETENFRAYWDRGSSGVAHMSCWGEGKTLSSKLTLRFISGAFPEFTDVSPQSTSSLESNLEGLAGVLEADLPNYKNKILRILCSVWVHCLSSSSWLYNITSFLFI